VKSRRLVRFSGYDYFIAAGLAVSISTVLWFMFGKGIEIVRQLSVSIGQVWPVIMFSLLMFVLRMAGQWKKMEVHLQKAPSPEDKKWGVLVIVISVSFIFSLFSLGLYITYRLKMLDWMTSKDFIIGIILIVVGIELLNTFRRLWVWRSAMSIIDLEDSKLLRVIETVNAKSDVKCLFVMFDNNNADNIGMEPIRKCLVVGKNRLKYISEEELSSVVLHEYGHLSLRRWEMARRFLSYIFLVSSLCLPFVFLNNTFLAINSDNFDLILIFALSFSSIVWFMGTLLTSAVNRSLEKKADLFAVKHGGRDGLISHLKQFVEWHCCFIGFFEYLECDHPLNSDRVDYLYKA